MTNLKAPPRGWKAKLWRAPIWLYRWNLGWLLGNRFMLLSHTGRKSGLPRQAVIEIIGHDEKIYYAASGFGEKAHWYQNIIATPEVTIQIGRKKFAARAERLPYEEAKVVLDDYAQKHATSLRELSKMVGLSYDGSEESLEKLLEVLPILAFRIH